MEFRLAWREIFNNRRFSLFFVFNLVLGLFGFLSLDAFKGSIQQSLAERSRLILTADLAVQSRRAITPEEEKIIRDVLGPGVEETRLWMLYSMVSSPRGSRLANVTAIEDHYPFYGQLKLDPGGIITGNTPKDIVQKKSAWLYPETALALGVKPGDLLKIGAATFRISHLISEDAGNGWRSFDLAPRVYIGMNQLSGTGLIRPGSVVWYHRLFRLRPDQDADALVRKLDQRLKDPGLEVESARDSSESVGRLQGFLNDYLGLAALISLFLAAIGAAYLFRSFLSRRLQDIAILMSLGLDPRRARRIYLLQLGILGAVAALVSSILAILLLPFTIKTLGWFLAYPIHPVLRWGSAGMALLVGAAGSILICLPFLSRLRQLNTGALFQESGRQVLGWSARSALSALSALLLYWMLALWEAHSWKVGSLFAAVFLVSGAGLAAAGWLGLRGLDRSARGVSLIPRLAFRNLSRNPFGSLSIFVAIGLGTLLMNLIPQVQKSLGTEIAQPQVSQVPSLFLFDIQDNQVEPLQTYLRSQGVGLESLTPLIRGRLISVNQKAFEKEGNTGKARTREGQQNARFHNRSFNLTYRGRLSESEKIVKGKEFNPALQDPPEISVEGEFAKRLGLHLGDVLEFDVQGVSVRGRIVNFRKVQWASFQPNFFVQFQPGLLEGAPKTFLASIRRLDPVEKARLQNGIVAHFPNVSLIDISVLVEKILSIFTQMGWALRVMAMLSLFAGFVVLFSIANHQASQRREETNLLKVLGAGFPEIRGIYNLEFGGLTFAAAFCGTAGSFAMSYLLSQFLFDHIWVFSWAVPLGVMVAVPLLAVATVHAATGRVLYQRPLALLQADR